MKFKKLKKQYSFRQSGFTLIELIVTISIMALILSLTLANLNGTEQARNTSIAQNILISDLHKIQTFSLNSANDTVGVPVSPSSSWSIHVNSTSPSSYDLQVTSNAVVPVTTVYSTTNFPKGVTMSSLFSITTSTGACYWASDLTIYFTVPYGRILMSYTARPCSSGAAVVVKDEANDIAGLDFPSGPIIINGIAGNINSTSGDY
jgi:prepilin-type N-terminal cleavage/methylation domain-containing protein